ncbi:Conserrved hypothetical protein [gamma proteobacterium HdN1]|nr:Conserrved hypothetical protein [gamma proteobacterium HdN1]
MQPSEKPSFLNRMRESLLAPKVDDKRLEAALLAASTQQPPPVLWLVGKTQSGKTSLIKALTGSDSAEIGNGFRPCTRTASFYDYPAEAPVVRFLDTRGLGEVNYNPDEDIQYCEAQSHLLIAVMKAMDLQQSEILKVLGAVRKRHPDWPILVVHSCLHEAYAPDAEHPQPYPFGDFENAAIPSALQRSLLRQQEWFTNLPGVGQIFHVAVDFTHPDDGYSPQDYGLEALWQGIEAVSSLGLRELLRADSGVRDTYAASAHPHIVGYSIAAAGIGALPVVDLALLPALQMKMLHTLASIYQRPWTQRTTSEFLGALGAGFFGELLLRWAGRSVIKLVPAWGQTLGALWGASSSAALTFALGKTAVFYLSNLKDGVPVESETLKGIYASAFEKGLAMHLDNAKPQEDTPHHRNEAEKPQGSL